MTEPKDKTYREDEELNSIFVEFLSYLPYSEDDSIEVEAKHNALKAIQEHIEGVKEQSFKEGYFQGGIDEVGKFIDAITENEAEREMRGEDCIESHQWQRLSKMADYRIKQLKDKGGK